MPIATLAVVVLTACRLVPAGVLPIPATAPPATAPPLLPTARPTATIPQKAPGLTPDPPTLTLEPPRPTLAPPSKTPSRTSRPVNPTPTILPWHLSVNSMGRLSLADGWAITGGRLLWTESAGARWSDITPAGLSNCPAPEQCYIAGDPVFLDSSSVRIAVVRGQEHEAPVTLSYMYTENGGRSWGLWKIHEFSYSLMCPGYGCLSDVDLEFVGPQNGWLAARAPLGMGPSAAYLYRTRDFGQSWIALEMPFVGQVNFIDAWTGWAFGGEGRGLNFGLSYTRDAGSSWRPVQLEIPEEHSGHGYDHQEPVFFTRTSGMIPVQFHGPEERDQMLGFYLTGNAGGTWLLSATLEEPDLRQFGFGDPVPWSAIDESTWFVAVGESKQYLTRNRGQSWEMIMGSGLDGIRLDEVQFVSEAEGWGLGRSCAEDIGCVGAMFVTHDGGRTWTHTIPEP